MDGPTPQDQAFQAVAGYWTSQTLLAAARLGVADHLAGRERTAGQLAEAMGVHAPSLARLLRALATAGAVQARGGVYSLTPFGETLRSGVPGSMRSFFLGVMAEDHRRPWGELAHSVKTGETAFDRLVANHVAPEGLCEGLVTKADAEHRDAGFREGTHRFQRNACVIWRARPGRHHDEVRLTSDQLGNARTVVAHDLEIDALLAEQLHEVVGERVVVVDHQHARHAQSSWLIARSIARFVPSDFVTDSSYS